MQSLDFFWAIHSASEIRKVHTQCVKDLFRVSEFVRVWRKHGSPFAMRPTRISFGKVRVVCMMDSTSCHFRTPT